MLKLPHPSLDISKVNFDSVDEINEFASLLINVGNTLGILTSKASAQSEGYAAIQYIAKCWLNAVGQRMSNMTPSDAIAVIEAYELIHKIAYWGAPDINNINQVKLNAFDKMIHGDKQIDEYTMYRIINKAIRQHEPSFLDKPLTWSCHRKEHWYREALKGFDRTVLSDYDILNRVNILLDSDLMAYEGNGQTRFKKRLFEQPRHYLQSYDTSDKRMKTAIRNFRLASYSFSFISDQDTGRSHSTHNE